MSRPETHAVELRLTDLSADEMVAALGMKKVRPMARKVLRWTFWPASRRVARTLAQFDLETEPDGLARAATRALERFDVRLEVTGACPSSGPLLIIANHPGVYDALALMAACGRADLIVIAADNAFVRGLPRTLRRMLLVPERTSQRAGVLRRAYAHLAGGGAILQFAAGAIEPDPDFFEHGGVPLLAWETGTIGLVRAAARVSGQVIVAAVRGVNSPHAKRLTLTRWAERRGAKMFAPLVQVLANYTDVKVHVAFGFPEPGTSLAARTDRTEMMEHLRSLMLKNLRLGTAPAFPIDAAMSFAK
jgi:1-acyl-sn-glycerol-3-phosphate acyltransferase